jgi:hypothetical protein
MFGAASAVFAAAAAGARAASRDGEERKATEGLVGQEEGFPDAAGGGGGAGRGGGRHGFFFLPAEREKGRGVTRVFLRKNHPGSHETFRQQLLPQLKKKKKKKTLAASI